MRLILITVLIGVASLLTPGTFGQPRAIEPGPPSHVKTPSTDDDLASNQTAVNQTAVAMFRIRGYVDRVLRFRDVEAKVRTLAAMGDMLWKYDEPFGRRLFLQAYDVLKTIKINEGGATISSPVDANLTAARFADLRDQLISTLARRDTVLARRLSAADWSMATDSDRAMSDQRTAMNLLLSGNSARAVEFAERSMGSAVPSQMVDFLLQLRRRDEPKANELYLQTLNHLLTEPNVDGMMLMKLGVYVFTSPLLDPTMEERGTIVMQSVGNVGVINLSADRPGVPPQMVCAYLSVATQILSRPVFDPQQQKLYYVTGRQLLPKAQRFAPNLAPRIAAAIQSFIPSLSPVLMQDSTYDELVPDKDYAFEDTLREIDEITDEVFHDVQCVMIANGLCFSEDYEHASIVAEKIKDQAIRSRLTNLLASLKAVKAAEKGEISSAEEAARKIRPGIERAILWLAITRARIKEKSFSHASEAVVASLEDLGKSNDARRPFLMLSASGEISQLDPLFASNTLDEALKLMNAGDGKPPKWTETFEVGGRSFSFSLRGIEGNVVESTVRRLYSIDAQRTEAALNTLKHERILADGLRALSESAITSMPLRKGASAVRTGERK